MSGQQAQRPAAAPDQVPEQPAGPPGAPVGTPGAPLGRPAGESSRPVAGHGGHLRHAHDQLHEHLLGVEPAAAGGGPALVALGGGHGLAATLSSLRRLTGRLTAIVTVADDGGSSGRLRDELGVLPPGDLRMALAALCSDDDWGQTWANVLQHRFAGLGELHGHAVGNLLIVAIWELLGDHVAGLDLVGRLLDAHGRVLPMAAVPLDIRAHVLGARPGRQDAIDVVTGQVAVATTTGRVVGLTLVPPRPPACPQAVEAVRQADAVVLGPGSWFTSVIPHLLVPELAQALVRTPAARIVVLNLGAQRGETDGFSPENHLEVLGTHAPELRVDAVLADPSSTPDPASLAAAAEDLGGELFLADVADPTDPHRHDPGRLAVAFGTLLDSLASRGRMPTWR